MRSTVHYRSDAPTADDIRGFTLHADANVQNEPTVRNTKPHGATNAHGRANEATDVPAR